MLKLSREVSIVEGEDLAAPILAIARSRVHLRFADNEAI